MTWGPPGVQSLCLGLGAQIRPAPCSPGQMPVLCPHDVPGNPYVDVLSHPEGRRSPWGWKRSWGIRQEALGPSPNHGPQALPRSGTLPTHGQLSCTWRVRRSVYLSETPLEFPVWETGWHPVSRQKELEQHRSGGRAGQRPEPGTCSSCGWPAWRAALYQAWNPRGARRSWTAWFRLHPGRAQTAVRSQFRAGHD